MYYAQNKSLNVVNGLQTLFGIVFMQFRQRIDQLTLMLSLIAHHVINNSVVTMAPLRDVYNYFQTHLHHAQNCPLRQTHFLDGVWKY